MGHARIPAFLRRTKLHFTGYWGTLTDRIVKLSRFENTYVLLNRLICTINKLYGNFDGLRLVPQCVQQRLGISAGEFNLPGQKSESGNLNSNVTGDQHVEAY